MSASYQTMLRPFHTSTFKEELFPILFPLAQEIWNWCFHRNILLSANHILGQDFLVADFLSRGMHLPAEWIIHPSVFHKISLVDPRPEIDLFASSLTFCLPGFCSRVQSQYARKIDAFSFPWRPLRLYAFPPFNLLPRALENLSADHAEMLLVAPFWPRRPWFPCLLSLCSAVFLRERTRGRPFWTSCHLLDRFTQSIHENHFWFSTWTLLNMVFLDSV